MSITTVCLLFHDCYGYSEQYDKLIPCIQVRIRTILACMRSMRSFHRKASNKLIFIACTNILLSQWRVFHVVRVGGKSRDLRADRGKSQRDLAATATFPGPWGNSYIKQFSLRRLNTEAREWESREHIARACRKASCRTPNRIFCELLLQILEAPYLREK